MSAPPTRGEEQRPSAAAAPTAPAPAAPATAATSRPQPVDTAAADDGGSSEVFVSYVPTIPVRGGREHPAAIAESASLRCVETRRRREQETERKKSTEKTTIEFFPSFFLPSFFLPCFFASALPSVDEMLVVLFRFFVQWRAHFFPQ